MRREIPADRTLTWQPSLLGDTEAIFSPTLLGVERRQLDRGAWVDFIPGFLTGSDTLFAQILADAPWKAFERPMYDRVVGVPRLETRRWNHRPAVLGRIGSALRRHYGVALPSVSANLYRDGNDSVAWHGDRVGRHRADTTVAILSLGATRQLLLRPDGGGTSLSYSMNSGDLLIQGGTCQRTYEHCVPKRARAGPRISVMFRAAGGN